MDMQIHLGAVRALAAIGAILVLAGCGKLGSLDVPPHSTYPKIYPANAIRTNPAASSLRSVSVPATNFTPSGAWIDPDQHRAAIDPFADIDQKGSGGTGTTGASTGGVSPSTNGVGGGAGASPTP